MAEAPKGVTLTVTFKDAVGRPVEGLTLAGSLRRPTADKYDVPVRFTAAASGVYRAEAPNIEAGLWDLRAKATGGQHEFDIDERLVWRPSTQH